MTANRREPLSDPAFESSRDGLLLFIGAILGARLELVVELPGELVGLRTM